MALKGVKVLEFVGLAPGPFCGMILSDFGANVIRIDKNPVNHIDCLKDGKKTLALNLKSPKGCDLIRKLCKKSDVIIEPFRPGVMEKLGLGPDSLLKENPKLIYARLTGFGQNGPLASRAGHDLNYLALSGVLSLFGRNNEKPTAPINFAADFAGGGLLCALGICIALLERHTSGKGQIIDSAMVEGAAYVGSWLTRSQNLPIWGNERGNNVLDTGAHFYDTYETKDKKYMSVGAIEPQFYENLLRGLNLPSEDSQFINYDEKKVMFAEIFLTKTQNEWSEIFENVDACVYPVLDWKTANEHHHNAARNSFVEKSKHESNISVPHPAPRLSRTPGVSGALRCNLEQDEFSVAENILSDINLSKDDIMQLYEEKILLFNSKFKL